MVSPAQHLSEGSSPLRNTFLGHLTTVPCIPCVHICLSFARHRSHSSAPDSGHLVANDLHRTELLTPLAVSGLVRRAVPPCGHAGKLVLCDVVVTDHTSVFQKARHSRLPSTLCCCQPMMRPLYTLAVQPCSNS